MIFHEKQRIFLKSIFCLITISNRFNLMECQSLFVIICPLFYHRNDYCCCCCFFQGIIESNKKNFLLFLFLQFSTKGKKLLAKKKLRRVVSSYQTHIYRVIYDREESFVHYSCTRRYWTGTKHTKLKALVKEFQCRVNVH